MSRILSEIAQQKISEAIIEAVRAALPEILGEQDQLMLQRLERLSINTGPGVAYEITANNEKQVYYANTPENAVMAFLHDHLGLNYDVAQQPRELILEGRSGELVLEFKNGYALVPLEELCAPDHPIRPNVGHIPGLEKISREQFYGNARALARRANVEFPGQIVVVIESYRGQLRSVCAGDNVPLLLNAALYSYESDGGTSFRFPTPVRQGGAICEVFPAPGQFLTKLDLVSWTDFQDTPIDF